MTGSADDLLRLESLAWVRSWGSCRVTGWSLETEKFRPVVQHALRRLGRPPRGFAPFHFASRDGRRLPAMECLTDREERLARLRPGITPVEVLELVGAPDEHRYDHPDWDRGRGEWEYDFLTGSGWVTRLVCWETIGNGCRLREVRTVPAVWLTDPLRELKHLRG